MKRIVLIVLALLVAGTVQASAGIDLTPPDVDIRALEPPVDITPEQLAAQGTPLPRAPYAVHDSDGRDGHFSHRTRRHHHRRTY